MRQYDIAESQQLLLELACAEPTIQQCFKIIESTCLSQGICCKIDGKLAKDEFLEHLDEHYMSFCRAALRTMLVCGFVPWKTRKIPSGDLVPEVLPLGSFTWFTEPYSSSKKPKAHYHGFESLSVLYRVSPTGGMFKEEDIHVYIYVAPPLDIMNNSILYATIQSPLAHLLTDYKALRQGQIRRSHADAWNTSAKIITEFNPKLRVEDNPSQYLMDFVHEDHFEPPAGAEAMYPHLEAHNVWQREQVIRRQFQENPSTHYPEVFALPRDHTISQPPHLQPCEDVEFLLVKYRKDVCSLLGIPYEMISGQDGGGLKNESATKTMASGRIFSTNMQDYCKHIQRLLTHVYQFIYNDKSHCEFILVPMPRLEISSINDLKVLHEIGALTPDMSMQLSKGLLGEGTSIMSKKRMPDTTKNDTKTKKNKPNPEKNDSEIKIP
jgi:hypothetical protein